MNLKDFMNHHYRHFNAKALVSAAESYAQFVQGGNKMMVTLGGAMSTAEIGLSLAEMIRQDKVHAISCTGANLEEDLFNLIAHDHYEKIPHYRDLTPAQELELFNRDLHRVTDTCIPEEQAMLGLIRPLFNEWKKAELENMSLFPHEYYYKLLRNETLKPLYQIDPKNSWMVAAAEKNLPIFVPGWEDSTIGNCFASNYMRGKFESMRHMKSGLDYMVDLARWYHTNAETHELGFFQIGGGIAGDFPICVVPLLEKDMFVPDIKRWRYFCQVSDSTTSFGSYSGATPNEKITWGKLDLESEKFMIESDATIVVPLIFGYVLGW
jgi:deoxyhypusine synthase